MASLWIVMVSVYVFDWRYKSEFHLPSSILLTSTSYLPGETGVASTEYL